MTAGALILPNPSIGEELRRWGFAGALVCAAHAGLMAGYLLMPEPDPEGASFSPAVILELAPLPVAPASQQDLAPGPDMIEAQAAPTPPPQVEPEVVEPTPKLEAPVPSEVTLPEPKPQAVEQKSEDVPETPKPIEAPPAQQDTPAPQTTAAPRFEQNTAAVPAAPSPGSIADRKAIASWRELLMMRLQQNKRYPRSAEARRKQGVVTLNFTVDRSGRVLSRKIVQSSGVAALDQEVLAMIDRAQPLPAFPAAMTQHAVNLVVPIRFSLK